MRRGDRHRGGRLVVVAAVAAAVALGSVAVPVGAGAQTAVRGVTDTEVKVAGLGDLAGYPQAGQGAAARFDQANRDGEIPGGRKITYLGLSDDKSSPDTSLAESRRLVDQQGVFALVPVVTAALPSGESLNAARVPTVGWGIAAPFCAAGNKYVLGFTGCLVPAPVTHPGNAWGEAVGAQLAAMGKGGAEGKTAAVIAEDSATGKSLVESVAASAEAAGMTVVSTQAVVPAAPAPPPDYARFASALMTASAGKAPDVVFLAVGPAHALGLGGALDRAGFRGLQTNAVGYQPPLVRAVTGWALFTEFATPEAPAPAMAAIVSALKAAGVSPVSQSALTGWFAADMFVQILAKVGKRLTPERFQRVAARFTYEVDDVVGPTVFPQAFTVGTPCGQLATSDAIKFTITSPFACSELLTRKKGGTWSEVPYPSGAGTKSR